MPLSDWNVAHNGGGDGGVTYITDGTSEHFITVGEDCLIVLRNANTLEAEGSEPIKEHLDSVRAVAASRDGAYFATGGKDSHVKLFSYPSLECKGTATRFTLPVNALAFSHDNALLAAGGEDDTIRLIDIKAEGFPIKASLKKNDRRPVKCLAFDPKGVFLASCHDDGTVLVWKVEDGSLVKDLGKVAPSVAREDYHSFNRIDWHPKGFHLAVPSRNNDVTLFERKEFAEAGRLKEAHLGDVSLVSFSPNGLYCLTVGMDQRAVVWDTSRKQRKVLAEEKLSDFLTGAAWRRKDRSNSIALFGHNGDVCVWNAPVPASLPPPAMPTGQIELWDTQTARLLVDGEADEEGGEEGEDADGDANAGDDGEPASDVLGGGADDFGAADGDEGVDGDEYDEYGAGRRRGYARERRVALPVPQGPISPCATPMEEGATRRFLAYTTAGCITLRDDGEAQHIEVHFHDTERGGPRQPSMTDFHGITVGALGRPGAAYAAPAGKDRAAVLIFRPFESWGGKGEWTVPFPGREEVVALAVADSAVAVATSARLLRLISPGGVQTAVVSLAGSPVALAAQGSRVAAVWHAAAPLGSAKLPEQQLAFSVFDVDSQGVLAQGRLPITPGATLTWLGFTDEGALASGDSAGVLRVHFSGFGGSWVPVFTSEAARASDAEHHWIVGLSRSEVYAVVCKHPETHPQVVPRPVLSMLPLCMPMLSTDTAASESAVLRTELFLAEARRAFSGPAAWSDPLAAAEGELSTELNKELVKLFHAACKAGRHERAIEVAARMTLDSALVGALTIANKMRLGPLGDRLSALIEERRSALAVDPAGMEGAASQPPARRVEALARPLNPLARRPQQKERETPAQKEPAPEPAAEPAPAAPQPAKQPAAGDDADENDEEAAPTAKRNVEPAKEQPPAKKAKPAAGAGAAKVNPFARK